MKLFFKNILLLTVFSLVVAIVMLAISSIRNNQLTYHTPKDKNILIMGHSHTANAINDSIFTRAVNLSRLSRPLVVSCNYIQRIINDNSHIDTVLLAVNASLLSEWWGIGNSKNYELIESIWFNGVFNEKLELYTTNPKALFYMLIEGFRLEQIKVLITGMLNVPGGYLYLERDKLQENLERDHDELPYKAQIDTTLYEYKKLLETKKFLDEQGVHMILVDMPKYNPNDSIMEQQKFHALVKEHLPSFDYIDYVTFPLPIECYGDITHLNHYGAEIFSRYLQENGIGEYK